MIEMDDIYEFVSEEEDNIEMSEHETDSEQEVNQVEEEEEQNCQSYETTNNKTKPQNIIRFKSGPKIPREKCTTPKEVFKEFINDEMIRDIAFNTNSQIFIKRQNYNKEVSYIYDTDIQEIEVFIGLTLLAGVFRSSKENVSELWGSINRKRHI